MAGTEKEIYDALVKLGGRGTTRDVARILPFVGLTEISRAMGRLRKWRYIERIGEEDTMGHANIYRILEAWKE